MFLDKGEIRRSRKLVSVAFPRFGNWMHKNEADDEDPGFSIWGSLIPDEAEPQRCFFVTFTAYDATWKGHLTIGQHSYFWSSADCGDADLLDTVPCLKLEEAIANLKMQLAQLFAAFMGT